MRPALVLCLSLAITAHVAAQAAPQAGVVTAESAVVRSGPSDQMPETGTLYRGTKVVVDHQEPGGWLAIQPPSGQVGWVNHRHLAPVPGQSADVLPRNMQVQAEPDAAVAVGRAGLDHPLDVRRAKIPDGTIVLVIGHKVEHAGSFWYPIEPPHDDFRYVRRDAIDLGGPAPTVAVRSPKTEAVPLPPADAVATVGATTPLPEGNPPTGRAPGAWPNHPDWLRGEQAERDGDYGRAEQLYLTLAAEMNRPGGDADLANLCYTRIHAVREKARTTPAQAASRPGGTPATPAADEPAQWTTAGVLRVTGVRVNAQPTYAVVNDQGRVVNYAVAGPGVELERFRGYEVQLYGPVSHPADLRGVGIVTATQVRMPR